jgi:putative flippase GtrA
MHRFAREAVAFSVAGLTSTALDFAVFNALIHLGPLQANLISAVVGTSVSFSMNRRWTYRDRPRTAVHRELGLFVAVNLVGLGIQEIVLGLARYGLGFDPADDRVALNLFKLAGISAAMVFRFWAYRNVVFRRPPATSAAVMLAITGPGPIDDEFAELTWPLEDQLSGSELSSRGSAVP